HLRNSLPFASSWLRLGCLRQERADEIAQRLCADGVCQVQHLVHRPQKPRAEVFEGLRIDGAESGARLRAVHGGSDFDDFDGLAHGKPHSRNTPSTLSTSRASWQAPRILLSMW